MSQFSVFFFAPSSLFLLLLPFTSHQVHESGFGVQEDGMAAAQRVLLSDIPGQAVLALLQYLYTAQCSVPASLQPHVLELASRSVSVEEHLIGPWVEGFDDKSSCLNLTVLVQIQLPHLNSSTSTE